MNSGTRGCPIREGVVLAGSIQETGSTHEAVSTQETGSIQEAGSTQENNTECFVIMEIGYKENPIEFSLPYNYPVHSLAMVYDRDTELLTVAGGILYEDNYSTSIAEVWQLKLYERTSDWEKLPDLPYKVFDPVLISSYGDLYVLGGYTNSRLSTIPANATIKCVKLPMGKRDEGWKYIQPLQRHLDHQFGGRGVSFAGNIIVFAKGHAQRYNLSQDYWETNDLRGDKIIDCTPVLDPYNNVVVSRTYTSTKGRTTQDIAKYNFSTNTWTPEQKYAAYNFNIHHGTGRFLSLMLDQTDVHGKKKRCSKVKMVKMRQTDVHVKTKKTVKLR